MRRRQILSMAVLGMGALWQSACGALGSRAPAFETESQYGRAIRLSDYRGKALLLAFWATWCPHCRNQMAEMQRMFSGYARTRVELLALAMDNEGWSAVRPYLAQSGISFSVGLAPRGIARQYGATRGIPMTVAINAQGEVVAEEIGGLNLELLEELAAKAAGTA